MPELLGAQGEVCRNFSGLRGGNTRTFGASRGVCRNFCGLTGGYAGTFVGSRGGTPELLWAWGGYAGTSVGLGGGMPVQTGCRSQGSQMLCKHASMQAQDEQALHSTCRPSCQPQLPPLVGPHLQQHARYDTKVSEAHVSHQHRSSRNEDDVLKLMRTPCSKLPAVPVHLYWYLVHGPLRVSQ